MPFLMHMVIQQVNFIKESIYELVHLLFKPSPEAAMHMATAVKSYRDHILFDTTPPTHLAVKHPRNIKQAQDIISKILGQQ